MKAHDVRQLEDMIRRYAARGLMHRVPDGGRFDVTIFPRANENENATGEMLVVMPGGRQWRFPFTLPKEALVASDSVAWWRIARFGGVEEGWEAASHWCSRWLALAELDIVCWQDTGSSAGGPFLRHVFRDLCELKRSPAWTSPCACT
jgi:hypothetical protein